jgi:hypothetical protein
MSTKQKTSNKVQNAKGRTRRGELPGDKKVNRNKRSAAGVTFIPQGHTLPEKIREDRMEARAAYQSQPKKPAFNSKQLQKEQVDRAYRSLKLDKGTFEAKVTAAFMKAWLSASPDKSKNQTRTGLAFKAAKELLVSAGHATPAQADNRQVRLLLNNAAKAVKDAFVPLG